MCISSSFLTFCLRWLDFVFIDLTNFISDLMPELPVPAVEAILAEKQVSPRIERPNSSQGRKRPGSSLQKELDRLINDEGVQGASDVDAKRPRRDAAIRSELRQQQGQKLLF